MTGKPPNHNKDWQDLSPIDALLNHDDADVMDSACALKQDPPLGFIKDHMDLHSTLYRQHALTTTTNRSTPSPTKRSPGKMAESNISSKSKLKPMTGTGTITVVTKTTTTTTITGFPVVGVSSRAFNTMAQHAAQQAPSPNNSSSSDSTTTSSSSDDEDDSNDEDDSDDGMRSMGWTTASSSYFPAKRQKHHFPCAYQRHKLTTTTSTSTHLQAASQSRTTPKILKSKSMKKTPMAKNKRTTTSYDAETTAYLKKAFFNYYSKQYKLTREQREVVIQETGLHSRNITYWFSNHKRRLGTELAIYRELTRKHNIKDYDAFVQWRQDRALPPYITREEVRLFRESH